MLEFVSGLDRQFIEWGNGIFHNPVIDPIMIIFTYLGESGIIWIALAVILFFFRKYRKISVLVAISLACSLLTIDLFLKNIIQRPRPFLELTHIQLMISPPPSFSFPSGHAGTSFAAAVMLILCLRRNWLSVIAGCLALLVPFTRLYLLVHYPSDILAGAVIGTCYALMVYFIYSRWMAGRIPVKTQET